MHPNFFHWHARAELKPDLTILEPRWNAAAKFAEKLSVADMYSLLRLVLFTGVEPEFAKRFSEALVKIEPTFPPERNAELLRVMATAAVYSQMDEPCEIADAIALGLQSATFLQGRIEPVCQEVMARAADYLASEGDKVRPNILVGTLTKAEKRSEAHFAMLKKSVEANSLPETAKATEAIGRGLLTAMKENYQNLDEVIDRLAEESQFLWWLIGRRSPALGARRELLTAEAYALPAAEEAAKRVALLPPAASVESILDEVLEQCGKTGRDSMSLAGLIDAADTAWVQNTVSAPAVPELTPLAALLGARRAGVKLDTKFLKQLRISPKTKVSPTQAAQQYFRELIFLRAVEEVG